MKKLRKYFTQPFLKRNVINIQIIPSKEQNRFQQITAICTLILALFSILMYFSQTNFNKQQSDYNRSNLRPYVGIDGEIAIAPTDKGILIKLKLTNFGNLPAYYVQSTKHTFSSDDTTLIMNRFFPDDVFRHLFPSKGDSITTYETFLIDRNDVYLNYSIFYTGPDNTKYWTTYVYVYYRANKRIRLVKIWSSETPPDDSIYKYYPTN